MTATTKAQRDILRHSLGLSKWNQKPTRNHFCAEVGDAEIEALIGLGLMRRGATINDGQDFYAHVTDEGKAEVEP